MAPARLILIRHGNTASNGLHPNPKMSGWTDSSFSEIGWEQAWALRARMEKAAPPAFIYSSPLQRAYQTAMVLRDLCPATIRVLPEIKELNCGSVDGLPIHLVRSTLVELWNENMRQEKDDFRWPGGESYRELRQRSLAALDRIAAEHPGERVWVVSHCGVISQVVGELHGVSPARWERFRVENASVSELLWSKSCRQIVSFNDCSHLQGLSNTKAA